MKLKFVYKNKKPSQKSDSLKTKKKKLNLQTTFESEKRSIPLK